MRIKHLRLVSKSTLLLMILLTVTTSTTVVSAEGPINQTYRIRFGAFAAGKCFTGYGEPGPAGSPEPYEWYGIGRGSAGFSGRAKTIPLEESLLWPDYSYIGTLGDTYVSESLRGRGFVSLCWKEDGSRHWLLAVLWSTPSTMGVFVPEVDCFTVPFGPRGVPEDLLRFRGIHASGSEIQRISGVALFAAFPPGFGPESIPSDEFPVAIGVILLEENTETQYIAAWTPEEIEIPIAGPSSPTVIVPAAKIFCRKVKVVG